jgi:hypothetical protein
LKSRRAKRRALRYTRPENEVDNPPRMRLTEGDVKLSVYNWFIDLRSWIQAVSQDGQESWWV